jgi:hypothetical protein
MTRAGSRLNRAQGEDRLCSRDLPPMAIHNGAFCCMGLISKMRRARRVGRKATHSLGFPSDPASEASLLTASLQCRKSLRVQREFLSCVRVALNPRPIQCRNRRLLRLRPNHHLLARTGRNDELAKVVGFLGCHDRNFVMGSEVLVDGKIAQI